MIPGGTPGYENSSEPVDIEGCTDSSACNYDTEATLMMAHVNFQKKILIVMEIV